MFSVLVAHLISMSFDFTKKKKQKQKHEEAKRQRQTGFYQGEMSVAIVFNFVCCSEGIIAFNWDQRWHDIFFWSLSISCLSPYRCLSHNQCILVTCSGLFESSAAPTPKNVVDTQHMFAYDKPLIVAHNSDQYLTIKMNRRTRSTAFQHR